jgi:hypothetical protein
MVKNLPMWNGSTKRLEIHSKLIMCEHYVMYIVFTNNRFLEIKDYMFNYFCQFNLQSKNIQKY